MGHHTMVFVIVVKLNKSLAYVAKQEHEKPDKPCWLLLLDNARGNVANKLNDRNYDILRSSTLT